jgi:hypothetical protein
VSLGPTSHSYIYNLFLVSILNVSVLCEVDLTILLASTVHHTTIRFSNQKKIGCLRVKVLGGLGPLVSSTVV